MSLIQTMVVFGIVSVVNGADKPNVLFMLIDDLGWNDISFHNGDDFKTPNIDSLRNSGLTLNNYYVQHICTPTRSTILSGLYPIHTGLQHYVLDPASPYGLPLEYTSLPQELKKVGYDTHMIGKWHLGFFNKEYTPTYRGFDTYFGYYNGAEDYYTHYVGKGFDFRNNTQPIFINNTYSTYIYGNLTLDILAEYDSNNNPNKPPFFIYLPFQGVHAPLEAPQNVIHTMSKTISNYNRSVKAAMITVLDVTIGTIIDALKNQYNLWDNLLLIFSTDNGGPVYYYQKVTEASSNWPLRGSKGTLYEGGLRGVGFVTGGYLNKNRRGQISNEMIHSTDWLPTICEVVGKKPTNESILDGMSMFNVIQNNAKSTRTEILHNIDPINCMVELCGAIRMNEWKLVVGQEVDTQDLCFTGWCYTYEIHNGSSYNETTIQCGSNPPAQNYSACPYNGKPCLYNIELDPCEYHDVSAENKYVFNQLYDRLKYYNSTMVPPLQVGNKDEKSQANPQNFGDFWTPWHNSSYQNQTIYNGTTV
eukprot:6921_1